VVGYHTLLGRVRLVLACLFLSKEYHRLRVEGIYGSKKGAVALGVTYNSWVNPESNAAPFLLSKASHQAWF